VGDATCKTCPMFAALVKGEHDKTTDGRCAARPPVVVPVPLDQDEFESGRFVLNTGSRWPEVEPDSDWCGWHPKRRNWWKGARRADS
jgi:hypothetical protein